MIRRTYVNGNQENVARRDEDEPAPTLLFGNRMNDVKWVEERPAPTIVTTRRSDKGIIVGRQLPEGEGRNVGGHGWNDHQSEGEAPPCGCEWDVIDGGGFCACCEAHIDDPDGIYALQGSPGVHRFPSCPTRQADWTEERPSTAVCGDPCISPPGYRGRADDYDSEGNLAPEKRSGDNAVRVSIEEASILQGFSPDHPWQGSRTKQFQQIGNAVPPPLARAILSALLEAA